MILIYRLNEFRFNERKKNMARYSYREKYFVDVMFI